MDPIANVATKLEARTSSFVREERLPGAMVGVVDKTGMVWSAAVGFADVGERRPPDAGTLYRVASITKTITGTAIMQLRDAGKLHLDDPAVEHLPELRRATAPFGRIEHVTIRRMLSHESGLAGDPPGTEWADGDYEGNPRKNLARAELIGTKIPSNLHHKYSNLAYQLLGEVVARASGAPYVEYVNDEILQPLEMHSSAFEPLPAEWSGRRATGYAGRSFSDFLDVASEVKPCTSEGGLWSCLGDMAKWVRAQIATADDRGRRPRVLEVSTLKEMHTPRYLGDDEWTEAWGISWYAIRRNDCVWVQHSGGLPGFNTNVCFDPKEGVGAVALINGVASASDLAMDLASIARDAVRAVPQPILPASPVPESYRSLLGFYLERQEAVLLRLEWRDRELVFVDPDDETWRPTLDPTDNPDVFVVRPGVRESGEEVIFRRSTDGRVSAVLLASTNFVRLDAVR